jgi:hypothetical protein
MLCVMSMVIVKVVGIDLRAHNNLHGFFFCIGIFKLTNIYVTE